MVDFFRIVLQNHGFATAESGLIRPFSAVATIELLQRCAIRHEYNKHTQERQEREIVMATIVTGGLYNRWDGKLLDKTLQQISEGNFGALITLRNIVHEALTFVNEFPVEVPADFTLDGCPREAFSPWNLDMTDANFPKNGLQKGKKYMAEIYRLNRNIGSETLVKIAQDNKRQTGGALGGAILCSRYGWLLPASHWVICIDRPENLWQSADDLKIPVFVRYASRWGFRLDYWRGDWPGGDYVVFFRESSNLGA